MDELAKLISEKVGISESQAKAAIEMVLNHLKERLPGPIASQIDGVLSGGGLTGAAGVLGGILGNR
jgi:uncharacterized protein (DUF2267 family)